MRRLGLSLLVLGCLSVAGCSTLSDLSTEKDGQRIYGGTRTNVALVGDPPTNPHAEGIGVLWGILDFPFSLILDTGILPVTLTIALFR
jgi:uncharacterized protein YceK